MNCGECAEINVAIPETIINLVKEESDVTVTADAYPGQEFKAMVTEVGVATGAGATFPVKVKLTGDCPGFRSGMAADVQFDFGTSTGAHALVVPPVSVGEDREGRYVFVLQEEGGHWYARRRAVDVSDEGTGSGLQITSGLDEGELVATAGVRRIQDGIEVKLLEE